MIKAILAVDENNAIGNKGQLPWPNLPLDLQNFQKLTTGHHVVMGRKTWESLPKKYRPLPNRTNTVVTNAGALKGATTIIPEIIDNYFNILEGTGKGVWIIGGAQLIEHLINKIEAFYITRVRGTHTADTYIDIDNLLKNFTKISRYTPQKSKQPSITFELWHKFPRP